ncbi:Calcineurin-like phosphoesterase [Propionibacterium cyclohexanicum]|uniref:Calcineurin-like phosphoesterase n=1 Tax=Propionibacterium cyclohexanicum TaxID=64702 RepID=A0A1H9QB97_9ACTN|nr:metallophosphoesterase [Propionibacterium cyclohexanicum]SER57781.1 Calcineurin-like phosphoesterase [Propionibacterium cyclohexanicum]
MSLESAQPTLVHLSDIHATHRRLLYGTVDGLARLRAAGQQLRDARVSPEAVIITGDLVERGEELAYPAVAQAVRELADTVDAPVITAIGNHDDPVAAHQLPGHAAAHHQVVIVNGLRIVVLDSHAGLLGPDQLAWLSTQLTHRAARGTIVALHHPPLGSPLPALANAGLRDADSLLDVLCGSDVRLVLAGHFHHSMSAVVRGIPISVASSLAYHQVMNAGPEAVSGHDESQFCLIRLLPHGFNSTDVHLTSPAPLFSTPLPAPTH